MKILNIISTLSHGRGGHIYDLITITEELQKRIEIVNINICKKESQALNLSNIKLINLKFNVFNFLNVFRKIIGVIKENEITHINCYDLNSLSFANIINLFLKVKIIYTKCGGPNPTGYYPNIDNLLVMSKENFNFFNEDKKFKQTHKVIIPNRVGHLNSDKSRILELKEIIGNPRKVILRISRITEHYESTLFQAVNLYNYLNASNKDITLVIMGVVQNKSLLDRLKRSVINKESAFFITDNHFTHNASEIIPIADFVIGTGRGVMEASFFNKILLTPIKNGEYPVLINKNNFHELFETNFSPRNIINEYDEKENIKNIEQCIADKTFNSENISFVKSIHNDFFDIKTAYNKYYVFYDKCIYSKIRIYDLLRMTLSMMKKFLKPINE